MPIKGGVGGGALLIFLQNPAGCMLCIHGKSDSEIPFTLVCVCMCVRERMKERERVSFFSME